MISEFYFSVMTKFFSNIGFTSRCIYFNRIDISIKFPMSDLLEPIGKNNQVRRCSGKNGHEQCIRLIKIGDYCKDHRCSFPICLNEKQRNSSLFCRDHGCSWENCTKYGQKGSCIEHRCSVSDCYHPVNEKYNLCLDHRCHYKNNFKKCSNPNNLKSKYCVDHVCEMEECKERKRNQKYCKYHGCRNYECDQRAPTPNSCCNNHKCLFNGCQNDPKKSSLYCYHHKCFFCPKLIVPGFSYCLDHKCPYENCHHSINDTNSHSIWEKILENACWNHRCCYVDYGTSSCPCQNVRVKDRKYCLNHFCAYPQCNERRGEELETCVFHKCRMYECKNVVTLNAKLCLEHKCMKDDCPNLKHSNGFCLDHLCQEFECHQITIQGSRYCAAHKCPICPNNKICPSHFCPKCLITGCGCSLKRCSQCLKIIDGECPDCTCLFCSQLSIPGFLYCSEHRCSLCEHAINCVTHRKNNIRIALQDPTTFSSLCPKDILGIIDAYL